MSDKSTRTWLLGEHELRLEVGPHKTTLYTRGPVQSDVAKIIQSMLVNNESRVRFTSNLTMLALFAIAMFAFQSHDPLRLLFLCGPFFLTAWNHYRYSRSKTQLEQNLRQFLSQPR